MTHSQTMATFSSIPSQQPMPASAHHQDFLPSSPPDHMILSSNISTTTSNQQPMANGTRNSNRHSGEYRGQGGPNGGKAIPNAGPRLQGGFGGAAFDGPRSPPATKSTAHVPCKFFKLGQCQAGKACPFSHSTDASKFEQPCKYFAKGNCKFGHKCALLHILPNGRVVNRPTASMGQLNLGSRVEPMPYHQESALGNSLAQQAVGFPSPFGQQIPYMELDSSYQGPMTSQPYDIPHSESNANRRSFYDEQQVRATMSPPAGQHLSALDAPLPASFDSQGISYIARHGPIAASVPSKFGLESSPPPSLPKKVAPHPTDTLRNLQDSAYSRDAIRISHLGSSPSGPLNEPMGQRIMHSQRISKPKMVSSSLPRPGLTDEWEADELLFGGEEEYIPGNLSHLLSAEEKTRRTSGKIDEPYAVRESLLMGIQTSGDFSSKMDSPSNASPSRFSALFNRQKREEELNGMTSSSLGHVGSPLRNTSAPFSSSPFSTGSARTSLEMGFQVSSPPRHSSTSMLSQQLQRTRLSSRAAETGAGENNNSLSPGLHSIGSSRHTSNPRMGAERAVSASSVNTTRIDEEREDFVFALDEDLGSGQPTANNSASATGSNPNPWNQSKPPPNVGSIGDGRRSLDNKREGANTQGGKGSLNKRDG